MRSAFLLIDCMSAQPPWKAWYKTARWRCLRLEIFVRDSYTCQCGCGLIEGDTSQLVCDHRRPHRGDERLFWDRDNLWTWRKPCHDRTKQKAEQSSLHTRGVWY
jgi:5-methylcytosine-specific restriction protein A